MCETCMERELRAFWSRLSYWHCLAHDALDLSYFLLFFSAHAFLIFPTRQYSLRYERSHDTEVGLCFASPLPLSCDRCAGPLNAELSHFRRMTTLLLQPILSSKRKKKKKEMNSHRNPKPLTIPRKPNQRCTPTPPPAPDYPPRST